MSPLDGSRKAARSTHLGAALALALLCLAPAVSAQDEGPVFELERIAEEQGALTPLTGSAVTCPSVSRCTGLAEELFFQVLIDSAKARLVLRAGPLKTATGDFGCGETYSLYLHNDDFPNLSLALAQLVVAEKTGDVVDVAFRIHNDPVGTHCDVLRTFRTVAGPQG